MDYQKTSFSLSTSKVSIGLKPKYIQFNN